MGCLQADQAVEQVCASHGDHLLELTGYYDLRECHRTINRIYYYKMLNKLAGANTADKTRQYDKARLHTVQLTHDKLWIGRPCHIKHTVKTLSPFPVSTTRRRLTWRSGIGRPQDGTSACIFGVIMRRISANFVEIQ